MRALLPRPPSQPVAPAPVPRRPRKHPGPPGAGPCLQPGELRRGHRKEGLHRGSHQHIRFSKAVKLGVNLTNPPGRPSCCNSLAATNSGVGSFFIGRRVMRLNQQKRRSRGPHELPLILGLPPHLEFFLPSARLGRVRTTELAVGN